MDNGGGNDSQLPLDHRPSTHLAAAKVGNPAEWQQRTGKCCQIQGHLLSLSAWVHPHKIRQRGIVAIWTILWLATAARKGRLDLCWHRRHWQVWTSVAKGNCNAGGAKMDMTNRPWQATPNASQIPNYPNTRVDAPGNRTQPSNLPGLNSGVAMLSTLVGWLLGSASQKPMQ